MKEMITPAETLEEIRLSQPRVLVPAERDKTVSSNKSDQDSPKRPASPSESNKTEELIERVSQFNTELANSDVTLKIQVDRETGKNLIKVIDRKTGEVLREIPPEEVVRLEARIEKMIGLFFDRSV